MPGLVKGVEEGRRGDRRKYGRQWGQRGSRGWKMKGQRGVRGETEHASLTNFSITFGGQAPIQLPSYPVPVEFELLITHPRQDLLVPLSAAQLVPTQRRQPAAAGAPPLCSAVPQSLLHGPAVKDEKDEEENKASGGNAAEEAAA